MKNSFSQLPKQSGGSRVKGTPPHPTWSAGRGAAPACPALLTARERSASPSPAGPTGEEVGRKRCPDADTTAQTSSLEDTFSYRPVKYARVLKFGTYAQQRKKITLNIGIFF